MFRLVMGQHQLHTYTMLMSSIRAKQMSTVADGSQTLL